MSTYPPLVPHQHVPATRQHLREENRRQPATMTAYELPEHLKEFLAHILLPDGSTVGGWAAPQIEKVYATGKMPPLLPASTGGGS